jgi:hypothetical protein
VHPPPSPARTNFTLITECTPESSGCNSVYSVVSTGDRVAYSEFYLIIIERKRTLYIKKLAVIGSGPNPLQVILKKKPMLYLTHTETKRTKRKGGEVAVIAVLADKGMGGRIAKLYVLLYYSCSISVR